MSFVAALPGRTVPEHVPPELIWDDSVERFAKEGDDPFRSMARMHGDRDIVFSTYGYRGIPAWILTRHAHVKEAFEDYERFSSALHSDIGEILDVPWKLTPIDTDPPIHIGYRKILHPWFTPGAVNRLEPVIRTVCDDLIAEFEDRTSCEFIGEFASLFPARIFLGLLGLPLDQEGQFLAWVKAWMADVTIEERIDSARHIQHYLEDIIAARRAEPSDDIVSAIVSAEIDGRRLDEGEVIGICYNLFLAGLDTVVSMLGWVFWHLTRDRELQSRLHRHPDEIAVAADEMLRAYSVLGTRRTVAKDIDFHGITMKAGDTVILGGMLAARDPHRYADPHKVDVDRRQRHLTFGTGRHSCLGAHLARRELNIVLGAMLSRFRNLRIPPGETIDYHTGTIWGVDRLPLEWDPVST